MAAVLDVAVAVVNSLAHAMHNDGAVDDLSDGADAKKKEQMSVLRTRDNGKWTVGSENLRDGEREDDIQRRTTGDGDGKINQPNRGFDAGGSKVEGGSQFAGGKEADFDQGEEDGEARQGDDDGAADSV
jgi:hypothetical protein